MIPLELIRYIFELAAASEMPERLATTLTLSLVCATSRVWMRTILYKTVCISLPHEWEAFRRTVLAQPGTFPVLNLSVLVRPPPPGDDFAAVIAALPQLKNVQVALCLVPNLAGSSVRAVFVSKHGPSPPELSPTLRLTRLTRLFVEPFYSGLYPPSIRTALPTTFPALTHFGMAYVLSTDAVARDLLGLVRRMLALPDMQRVYIRVLSATLDDAEQDAERLGEECRQLRDARVFVGYASTSEWLCPPGTERVNSARSLWASDANGRLDMWNHGRAVWSS